MGRSNRAALATHLPRSWRSATECYRIDNGVNNGAPGLGSSSGLGFGKEGYPRGGQCQAAAGMAPLAQGMATSAGIACADVHEGGCSVADRTCCQIMTVRHI